MSVTLFIAFAQIGPMLQPPTTVPANAKPEVVLNQQLDRLQASATAADVDATRLMTMEMSPFVGDEEGLKVVKGKVKEWLITNTIRSDPEVRDAIGKSLQRRRPNAPAGARGNR